jgi:hypothetical protein
LNFGPHTRFGNRHGIVTTLPLHATLD